jgi:hypothetical protein
VRGLPPAVRVVTARTSVEDWYGCALTRDGAVWCWHSSKDAAEPDEPPVGATPTAIAGLAHVTDLSASCAIAGGVRCFGAGGAETKIRDARALAVGGGGCFVRNSGRVACWYAPAPWMDTYAPGDVPGIHEASEVTVGPFGACAVQGAGTLVCWGAASLIHWDMGGSGGKPSPPTVLRGLHDVAHVSLGGDFPCLLRKSGRVLCWFPEDAPTLLPRNPLPPDAEVRGLDDAVALSGRLVLRRDGTLVEVIPTYDARGDMTLVSRPIGEGVLTDVVSVDGAPERGCEVNRAGAVTCWGFKAPRP